MSHALTGPDAYTAGLGGVIRAHRSYLGLTRDGMAEALHMSPRSYSRIEDNRANCPPGLLDTIAELITRFELDVDRIVELGRDAVKDPPEVRGTWENAVVSRACEELFR